MEHVPFVSVIMPIRNEEAFIERSLGAMLRQDYPHDRYEVLVVDGMSTDRTRDIVNRLAAKSDVPVRILDNPRRIVPCALNIGIRAAQGDVIVRMDGHAVAAEDYIRQCITVLHETDADNVGGIVTYEGLTPFSKAAGLIGQSRFGCGGAPARTVKEGLVDTVSFGCWPREAFSRYGLFDEYFVRSQDSELNYRIRLCGGRIWMSPRIRSVYFGRSGIKGLWKQYFQYGFWKTRILHKFGWHLQKRHFIPPLFVIGLILSIGALGVGFFINDGTFFLLGCVVPFSYLGTAFVNALFLVRQRRLPWHFVPRLVLAAAVMHIAWGSGFLAGLIRRPPRDSWQVESPALRSRRPVSRDAT